MDHGAAVLTRSRADVHHVVGGADGLLVVLHHDHRVAQVAQPLQRPDEPLVVPLMQADGGFIEHVEHAHQAAPDLAGQPDALGLATRERPGRPGQGQVVEADIEQELHPLAHFLEDAVGDHVLPIAQFERSHGLHRVANGQTAQLVDVPSTHGDGQRFGLEARSLARGAVDLAHVLLDLLAGPIRLGFAVPALQPGDDPLEQSFVGTGAPEAVLVGDVHRLGPRAVQHELLVLRLERLPRCRVGEAAERGHTGLQSGEVLAACPGPGRQCTLGQRE
jgi:hypothetical protein